MDKVAAVLVVDDNEMNRDLLVRPLRASGYAVSEASDGADALAMLRAEPFDLVLLDLLMPRMTGQELLQHLKGDADLRHLPVVVLSAVNDLDTIAACIQMGADDYLPRPFNQTILNARIRACLERKRLHDLDALAHREVLTLSEKLEVRVQEATSEVYTTNEQLRRHLRELTGMIDVARSIISVLDLDPLLVGIMELSKEVMNAEASSLLIMDPEAGNLRFLVATGKAGEAMRGGTVELGRGIAGYVGKTGESLLIPDAYQDPRFDPSYDQRTGFRTRSILTVPLRTNEGVIGVVQVMNKIGGHAFDQHDLNLFESFASMAGISLQNARLFDQIRKMAEDLREALEKERWLSIEKEKMGAYLPRHVVDEISRNREQKLALGGKTVSTTVLFSDIVGFTKLSEELEPQEVVGFLNEYMTAMANAVDSGGGIVDKFIGDGLMAIFLPQGEGDNHALRAVGVGLRMHRDLAGLREAWKASRPGFGNLQIRIGINTGEVVAGNIGSETRMDYTVIGDNVNLASRIESTGRAGEVHVSEAVYEAVKDRVEATILGSISVKNRVQPVEVYVIWDLRE
ncbi:MAG TPA: adenylate/guanylate cyclase domain-containing protein [Longimicrobiaceae bacterium]|nr:adenylate/guanylate cyclase domain-containing protein [Longimicrobiaceae bacterium]